VILCIDIGNTATKVAAVSGDRVLAARAVATGDAGALGAAVAEVEAAGTGAAVTAMGIASVVPAAEADAVAVVRGGRSIPLVRVGHTTPLPIRVEVESPETVGADRLCAAAGAVEAGRGDAVVVDVGSAVTIDRVRDHAFVGGAIMPGPRMMLDSLGHATGRLPALDLDDLDTLFPDTPHPTRNAIALGVGVALAGGIREAVRRLGGEAAPPVYLTGGLAPRVDPGLPPDWIRDPDLTLRGLSRIVRHVLGQKTS
jgi:type III pantothenate kinase